MVDRLPDLLAAIGGFHPMMIHFPIGLVAGLVGLEVWAIVSRRSPGAMVGPLLMLASAGAGVAAICGLLLARTGSFDAALISWHRAWGLAAVACIVAAWLAHRALPASHARRRVGLYRGALTGAVLATFAAGHYGGHIAHGRTPFAALIRALRGIPIADDDSKVQPMTVSADELYMRSIAPILDAHCRECHGTEKQENGLRLDYRAAALAGGKSGKPAIVPGDAMGSRLVEAITLPDDNKRAMPPSGKRRLTSDQVLLLIDWINRGAAWPETGGLRLEAVAAPAPEALAAVNAEGFRVSLLAAGYPLVRVDRVPRGARLSALDPITSQIAWLSLAEFALEPDELRMLVSMPNLTRLELQRSDVQDGDLQYVGKVPHLTSLNLYGTRIGDAGLQYLHDTQSLKRIYVWQTLVTPAGAQQLRQALPGVRIDEGFTETDRERSSRRESQDRLF